MIELDSNKIKSIKFSNKNNKVYKIISLDDSKYIYEKPKVEKYSNEFDKMFNSKPSLMQPMEEKENLIDNLIIIDIQSTLDVVVNYHLMKGINLKEYKDSISVSNLNICNFVLLSKVLKKYKISQNK